ncbi:MAG: beta-galactosidase [Acidobacteria bacterium]|nr:beta-galactosidase [Acidobacteriota bacterium]
MRGVEIVQHGGYPELRADGNPFFIHSAAFFYYRIPRDLWSISLDRHRDLGINTIDLYIPWNWHEPREGELDFDGRTNPRRDLRALLRLIAEKGFKLIARPGPVILNEWRHGGYPEWLLERPEFKMGVRDRLEGRYAPLSNLNASDAEAAARGWLENETHMRFARKWLAAVARELVEYGPRCTLRVNVPSGKRGKREEKEISGPLLFVQLDDDMAIGRSNYAGPAFWRYMSELRKMLEDGGLDVPSYINPTDMRVSAAGFGLERPIGAMGQWYLQPPEKPAPGAVAERRVTAREASTIEFFVEELKTQPAFPPVIIEYQAAWYTPGDDTRAFDSPVDNTLLSSRLLLAHGLHGLNYFPAQDTITPAGYSTPWTNRHYRWDAALDVAGNRQFRARAVARNGVLMESWGQFLASSHKRADFGLIYPLGAYPQEPLAREEILRVSQAVMRVARVAQLAGLSSELLDPQYQPVEQLLRYPLVFLLAFDSPDGKFQLSQKAQRVIVEYVRRGGTLAVFPARPVGSVIEQLWKSSSPIPPATFASSETSAVTPGWTLGQGRVLESTKDFYSWVSLDESFSENRARFESAWAVQALREYVDRAAVRPVVKFARSSPGPDPAPPGELVVTQLVSNAGSEPLGVRRAGSGLLSVTNLSHDSPAEQALEILSPRASARAAARGLSEEDFVKVSVSLPARESLLLPLHYPLCSAASQNEKCEDEIISAGAELLLAERSGKTLELTFYTPARATVALRLTHQPGRVSLDEDIKPESRWLPEKHRLEVDILRGAAPGYLRLVKINLPYAPQVPEKPDPSKLPRREFEYSVADAVRLPLTESASLPSDPPLVILDENREAKIILQGSSYDGLGRDIDFNIEGPVRGSGYVSLEGNDTRQARITLKPPKEAGSGGNNGRAAITRPDGLLQGELQVRSGRDRRSTPIFFAIVGESGVTSYQYDFDRDAAPEWVLENAGLRLIVSPEDGGRALALVDKSTGLNLTTNVGALRDHFAYTPDLFSTRPERARGRYGLFNRPYLAGWVPGEGGNALRLSFEAPDVFPSGAKIVKTVRLSGPASVAVDYEVGLKAVSAAETRAPGLAPPPEQSFIAVNSVPVVHGGERTTQFCWPDPSAPEAQPLAESSPPGTRCEDFVPGRDPLTVPEAVRTLEIRTPGRYALAVEWKTGRMTVEMKNFSALLKLQFPALAPGGDEGRYNVQFRVLPID